MISRFSLLWAGTISLALGALAALPAQALELTKIGGPVKIADASSFKYGYAPSIIRSGDKWHAYFCSAGRGVGDWDHVRYAASNDLQNWGPVQDLIQSTPLERANCDPSVVRFNAGDGLFYYMVYSGNAVNIQTLNFVARSESPTGPFLKLTSRGTWERNPADSKAIVGPKVPGAEGSGIYGAGQASLVVKDGKVYQFYTDVTATPGNIWLTTSTNMKDWSPPVFAGLDASYASVDVKYDDAAGEFVVVDIPNSHQANTSIRMRSSKDGLNWGASKTICDEACTPDFANNVGMSGDEQGHIFGDELLVGYGAPYGLGPVDNFAHWHVWATRFKLTRTGQIKGWVEGVGGSPATVNGWACGLKMDQSIDVHLYVGGAAGTGTMAGGVKANIASEPAVAEACQAGGKAYRFSIPLTPEVLAQHAGKLIYVHGISPVGGANDVIENSGKVALPGAAAPTPAAGGGGGGPTGPAVGAGSVVAGQPAMRFFNKYTGEHFFSTSAEEGTSAGYEAEGVGFKTAADGQPGTKKIYRCFGAMHFVSEDPLCESAGKNEGAYGSVFSEPTPGTKPLYRGYNPVLGLHLVTTNKGEFEGNGYESEGVLGYVPE